MSVKSRAIASILALGLVSLSQAASAADAKNGKAVFDKLCAICHAVSNAPGAPVTGPSLVNVVGRKAASVPGFALYSPALKASKLTWDVATLDEFLTMPMKKVPGTMMPMMIPDPKERGDVIAYLGTLKGK